MAEIALKGITWNHSRGLTPLEAASGQFTKMHPGVHIQWDTRNLQQFADYPIEQLTETYDLLIIDHPWVGTAAATRCILPLDEYLSKEYLNNQLQNSVGVSFDSYNYKGHQWALAIDAAAPAAIYRKDLLDKAKVALPQKWEDVLTFTKQGRVAVPAVPIDLLMNFYTFCIANGRLPFQNDHELIDIDTGVAALQVMFQLYSLVDKKMFELNPIDVAEAMANTNDYWYCPFAYCYSNYARLNFAKNVLTYTNVVNYKGQKLSTTIGGTGISVSAFSPYKDAALAFTKFVCSDEYQVGGYTFHQGQPGYLKAWTNDFNNSITNNFFNNLLPLMQSAYMRPRYYGYLGFQDEAGIYIQEYMRGNNKHTASVIKKLNAAYKQSFNNQKLAAIK